MSAKNSYLSNPHYGYDFVVATTQAAINATIKEFLDTVEQPTTSACFVAGRDGAAEAVDYETFKAEAGCDPFKIPADIDPKTDPDFKKLFDKRFLYGFQARLGVPAGKPGDRIPDFVQLGGDTRTVGFTLLCAEFVLVRLNPGNAYERNPTWTHKEQAPESPWLFKTLVDLRLSDVPGTAYDSLPEAVKKRVKDMGEGMFSVQQLLFDLQQAKLESVPTIEGVPPGSDLYTLLQQVFVGAYFNKMRERNEPVLSVVVVPHDQPDPKSTLEVSNFNFQVSPYVRTDGKPVTNPTDQQKDLATLNYLCATKGSKLPAAVPVQWNWVDESERNGHDGVLAVNRNTFARFLEKQLTDHVSENCLTPWVNVSQSWGVVTYKWKLTRGATPTVKISDSGSKVLSYSFSKSTYDEAGANGWMGQLELHPSYTLDVDFTGDKITVTQHSVVYVHVSVMANYHNANLFDKTITDVFTLEVDQNGALKTNAATTTKDDSKDPKDGDFWNFFTQIDDLSKDIKEHTSKFASSRFLSLPVSFVQDFVFPAGKTFTYRSVGFSDHQDLTSHITYVQPT